VEYLEKDGPVSDASEKLGVINAAGGITESCEEVMWKMFQSRIVTFRCAAERGCVCVCVCVDCLSVFGFKIMPNVSKCGEVV